MPLDSKCNVKDIERILEILEKEELIEQVQRGKYKYIPKFSLYTGKVDMTSRGSAYVICEDLKEDIYISPALTGQAFHGDTVTVELLHQRSSRRPEGRIIQITHRAKSRFIGTVEKLKGSAFVIPDDSRIHVDFYVNKKDLKGAKDQDKVLIEITEWPSHEKNPNAKVLEIMGKSGEHQTEMHAILAEYGFSETFPDSVTKEAERLPELISKDEIRKRKDYRDVLTFTIDPADAKDFDDALSFKKLENGNFEVGIHIADVSHYIRQGTSLDKEASERGTSVYLVDRVVPMLPEKISNHLCSLVPNQDRLCFAVGVEIGADAGIIQSWIGKSVIHSDRRFSYEEAQEILEKGEGDYAYELTTLNSMAKILKQKRFKNGAISFETEEVKFILDEAGKPISVYKKIRKDANKLIEEFMLLANRIVAEWVSLKFKKGTIPYRYHPPPSLEKIGQLNLIAGRFGYKIDMGSPSTLAKSLNAMTTAAENKPEGAILNPLAIRSMEKAVYTTTHSSHFGLAFSHYAHFTSPIRRYPDLLTHRLLFAYQSGEVPNQQHLETMSRHSSAMEQKATEAERASIKYKQTEYLSERLGLTFEGRIVSLTEWGIYIELAENKCEGMVRISEIKGDLFEFHEKEFAVIGRRTKRRLDLGQKVLVRVKKTNLTKRNTDFTLLEEYDV